MLEQLRRLVGTEGESEPEGVVFECRRCGTTLDADDESCIACGSEDVVRIQVE